jgi:hypothetical protein
MTEYLSWPAEGLDHYRLVAQTQVIRAVAMVGERQLDREREERCSDRGLGGERGGRPEPMTPRH